MTEDDVRTARWADVAWACPECGGELLPVDDRDPTITTDDIWTDDADGYDDDKHRSKYFVTTPHVVCTDCETEFDVVFARTGICPSDIRGALATDDDDKKSATDMLQEERDEE